MGPISICFRSKSKGDSLHWVGPLGPLSILAYYSKVRVLFISRSSPLVRSRHVMLGRRTQPYVGLLQLLISYDNYHDTLSSRLLVMRLCGQQVPQVARDRTYGQHPNERNNPPSNHDLDPLILPDVELFIHHW